MGCMPYGQLFEDWTGVEAGRFNPSYGLHALRAIRRQGMLEFPWGFNPSYGLHALRAQAN